ncbi:sigma 54-interacting transcriptional regulator [bacterium]|nr:sigma 54-interacting transcriptional regulator [bacterium]
MKPSKEQFFTEAIRRFCSSLDITIALRRLYDYFCTVMPVDILGIGVVEIELKCLREVAMATAETSEWTNKLQPIHEKTLEFIRTQSIKKPFFVGNVATDENLRYTFEMAGQMRREMFPSGEVSSLTLPLLIDENWIGTFHIASSGVNRFNQEHADLLEPLQEPFALVMSNCLQYHEIIRLKEILADDNLYLKQQLREVSGDVIGKDYGLKHVMEMVTQTAPRENPVMLFGETGTGKEVIANAIHYSSPRRDGPFVKVNCGAIPESLLDSELFGHERGAFTGAVEQKRGRFERANHGTIFLDEIGELPLQAQVRLLRVIQNKEIERVGGSETIPVNIRVIAATHRDLTEMTRKNEFREDLLYRLNVFPIVIPPLRQRRVDIPELVNYFIERKAYETKLKEIPKLSPGTLDPLIAYNWPGNVRELENVVERALIRYRGGLLTLDDFLSPQVQSKLDYHPKTKGVLPFDLMAKNHIREALNHTNGRISGPKGAARLLDLHPNTLRSKMQKYKL